MAYLPLVTRLGYTHDDWYLMASARAEGPEAFREIFSVDRPARALVMIPAYKIFGENPLYYNLSAYFFRLLGGVALLWSLNLFWRSHYTITTEMAVLFLIYPGFLSQPNGIDYQSHIVGLAAALASVGCTVQAVVITNRTKKFLLHSGSILLAWLYLGQMEWYIGFEFFRWAGMFLLSTRAGGTLLQKIQRTIQAAYPSLLGPGLFLIWRIFFFHSVRGATDMDIQFSQVRLYPLQTIYHWAIQVVQDSFDVTLSAWVIPLSQLTGYIQTWSIFLALLTIGVVYLVFLGLKNNPQQALEPLHYDFQREALLLALFTIVGGLLPIAMVNRDVSFPAYSRYSLVSSVGVAILIPRLLIYFDRTIVRNSIIVTFFFISVLTHHANTVKYALETSASNTFWWQIAWRVPQFEKDTTLIAHYPAVVTEEDYFIWGPASLIFYPEKQNLKNIQPGLFAAVANSKTVSKVQTRERQEYDKRKNIITYKNYRNIIILTQPTSRSCVHVINGNAPEYSHGEWDSILKMGPYSEIDHVLVNETPHRPPAVIFGLEPSHDWCFYYQGADLARQSGDWNAVLDIGKQAFEQGLSPRDLIEWMPFLQAYAQVGDVASLTERAAAIQKDTYIASQACQILRSMPDLSQNILEIVDSLYCPK